MNADKFMLMNYCTNPICNTAVAATATATPIDAGAAFWTQMKSRKMKKKKYACIILYKNNDTTNFQRIKSIFIAVYRWE